MVNSSLLSKLTQSILDQEGLLTYPLKVKDLETRWDSIFFECLCLHQIQGLSDKEYSKVHDSTYSVFLKKNFKAAKQLVKDWINFKVNQLSEIIADSATASQLVENLQSFIEIYTGEAIKNFEQHREILDSSSVNIEKTMAILAGKILRFIGSYESDACVSLRDFIFQIFESAKTDIFDLIPDLVNHSIKEQVLFIRNLIKQHKEQIVFTVMNRFTNFPKLLFDSQLQEFDKTIMDKWVEFRDNSYDSLENRFVLNIQEFISDLSTRESGLFDSKICDDFCKVALFQIISITAGDLKSTPQFRVFSKFLNVSIEPGILYDIDLENSWKDSAAESFLKSSTEKSRSFVILCLVLVLSGVDECVLNGGNELKYTPEQREWLRKIIYTAFERRYEEDLEQPPQFTEWTLVLVTEQILSINYPSLSKELEKIDTEPLLKQMNSTGMISNQVNQISEKIPRVLSEGLSKITSFFNSFDSGNISDFALEKLCQKKSLHTTIAISGWLSQDDDHKVSWSDLSSFLNQGETYCLKWESSTVKQIIKYFIPTGISAVKLVTSSLAGKMMAIAGIVKTNPFNTQMNKAKLTGMVLAELVISAIKVRNTPVSLIGFSLGTYVIMSCLLELQKRGFCVHDVVLLGGAAPMNLKKWETCTKAVKGRIVNVFSQKDGALAFWYRIATFKVAIGTGRIEVPGIENYDITDIVKGHQEYRVHMGKILNRIHFNAK